MFVSNNAFKLRVVTNGFKILTIFDAEFRPHDLAIKPLYDTAAGKVFYPTLNPLRSIII